MQNTYIKEIFSSIQGEGLYVGQKHIFVRFCKCNLACKFCDTDFNIKNAKEYSINELYEILKPLDSDVISFTGGEPLLDVDFLNDFLKEYKDKLNKKIYLETNGTCFEELKKIINYVDIIAMDIKLKSATGQENSFFENEEFIKTALNKELFIKIVFDENISEEEIIKTSSLAKKYNLKLILQPKMPISKNLNIENIFEKFYLNYHNVFLIPQTHKFLNLA